MAFIPEITTRVNVKADTTDLDSVISLTTDIPALNKYLRNAKTKLQGATDKVADSISETLSEYQRQIISMKHYRTGMMSNSIDISIAGQGRRLVGNTAQSVTGFPYPLAIEKGTKSHMIRPVQYRALHWQSGGQDHYSKGHMVSGIRADPFVEPSIRMTRQRVDDIVGNFIGEVFK